MLWIKSKALLLCDNLFIIKNDDFQLKPTDKVCNYESILHPVSIQHCKSFQHNQTANRCSLIAMIIAAS